MNGFVQQFELIAPERNADHDVAMETSAKNRMGVVTYLERSGSSIGGQNRTHSHTHTHTTAFTADNKKVGDTHRKLARKVGYGWKNYHCCNFSGNIETSNFLWFRGTEPRQ